MTFEQVIYLVITLMVLGKLAPLIGMVMLKGAKDTGPNNAKAIGQLEAENKKMNELIRKKENLALDARVLAANSGGYCADAIRTAQKCDDEARVLRSKVRENKKTMDKL